MGYKKEINLGWFVALLVLLLFYAYKILGDVGISVVVALFMFFFLLFILINTVERLQQRVPYARRLGGILTGVGGIYLWIIKGPSLFYALMIIVGIAAVYEIVRDRIRDSGVAREI